MFIAAESPCLFTTAGSVIRPLIYSTAEEQKTPEEGKLQNTVCWFIQDRGFRLKTPLFKPEMKL